MKELLWKKDSKKGKVPFAHLLYLLLWFKKKHRSRVRVSGRAEGSGRMQFSNGNSWQFGHSLAGGAAGCLGLLGSGYELDSLGLGRWRELVNGGDNNSGKGTDGNSGCLNNGWEKKATYAMSPSFRVKSEGGFGMTNCCCWDSDSSGTGEQ